MGLSLAYRAAAEGKEVLGAAGRLLVLVAPAENSNAESVTTSTMSVAFK